MEVLFWTGCILLAMAFDWAIHLIIQSIDLIALLDIVLKLLSVAGYVYATLVAQQLCREYRQKMASAHGALHSENIRKCLKVLIRLGCYFVLALVTDQLRKHGITLGGLPTALLCWLTFYIAEKLCELYDYSALRKIAFAQGMSPGEYALSRLPVQQADNLRRLIQTGSNISNYLNQLQKSKVCKKIYIVAIRKEYAQYLSHK